MPIDLYVTYSDGSTESFYIPLRMARMEKPNPTPEIKRTVVSDWAWAYPTYELVVPENKEVVSATIDPSGLMADIALDNNTFLLYKNSEEKR